LQIVVLRKVALSPSYVWKTQIVITNEIATEFFRLSVQPQLCLSLNPALSTLCGTLANWSKETQGNSSYERNGEHTQSI